MAFTPKLTYKGLPLVRCKNELYFGNPSDPCMAYLQILNSKEDNGERVADRVHIVLMSTDTTKELPQRIIRQTTKAGMYAALDIAHVWLMRAEREAKSVKKN